MSLAIAAFSVEEYGMGIDPSIYRLCQELTCVTHHADREVMDLAAGLAYEVIVVGGSEIKVNRAIAASKTDDLTQFHQKIQVSVYRTKTDIWKFFSDGEVESVGGWMIRTIHQTSLDRLSLSAVFKGFHLKPPSVHFFNNDNCYHYNSKDTFKCQPQNSKKSTKVYRDFLFNCAKWRKKL